MLNISEYPNITNLVSNYYNKKDITTEDFFAFLSHRKELVKDFLCEVHAFKGEPDEIKGVVINDTDFENKVERVNVKLVLSDNGKHLFYCSIPYVVLAGVTPIEDFILLNRLAIIEKEYFELKERASKLVK